MGGEDWSVALRRGGRPDEPATPHASGPAIPHAVTAVVEAPAAPQGIPVTSPMTGIYYSAASPTSPPFVTEGQRVEAGQVIALIEAMKVFNEITATTSGVVGKIMVESGTIVSPGDPLLYIS